MEPEGLKIDVRRRKIQDILAREGKVHVTQLSRELGASAVTIRNDLQKLEKDGYLERVTGGAVLTIKNYANMDFGQRKQERAREKQNIAAAAASLVQNGDTLFINSGTTAYFAAIELKRHKNLNIVTNSVYVAMELGGMPTFRVILLGGEINTQYYFTFGIDAIRQLSKYKADKTILSVDGVNITSGITTYHPDETELNRMMVEQSSRAIVVADYTKIGHVSFSHIEDISKVNVCVTNRNADGEVLATLSDNGVEVIVC